ncbi:MAG: 4-alpha-glucanotransferase [Chitinophagaceae bacterium]
MKLHFFIRYHTEFGQSMWITGNTDELGNNDPIHAIPMIYLNDDYWNITIEIKKKELQKNISYHYMLRDKNGEWLHEWENGLHDSASGKRIHVFSKDMKELQLVDSWNHVGEYENVFYSDAFKNVLLKDHQTKRKANDDKDFTHIFKVKAPLLNKNEVICLLGSGQRLKEWAEDKPVLLGNEIDESGNYTSWWTTKLDLSDSEFPVAYKYGVYNFREKKFKRFENENNRLLYSKASKKKITILHDGFVHLPNNTWKGAGVAIPLFSLKSKKSFGVGEFSDIHLLVDWVKSTGLKLIQLLPINDTMAHFNWMDSYPYSAISAFALHPIYINLTKVAGAKFSDLIKELKTEQKKLNELPVLDYEEVIRIKISALRSLFEVMGKECFESDSYENFYKENKQWLDPYSAFSYLRDIHNTSNFSEWKTNSIYNREEVKKLLSPDSECFHQVRFYYFCQYHLHIQLKEAVDYAHKKGIVLKGDIPIGISRNSCDAWEATEMFHLCWQAGAPPDDFTAVGQNWGFPTYNWKKMQEDGFAWWKQRFEQMSNYFDAFRIDHILGFFRIWSIPTNAVQGIMGRFVPCLPVHINEFGEKGIWFEYKRYCRPFIDNDVLNTIFGEKAGAVKKTFLVQDDDGNYELDINYETQRQVEDHFAILDQTDENEKLKLGLFELISNVILFDHEESQGLEFHFRISMEKTTSFKQLDLETRQKLKDLYIDYFYRRQDKFWFKEAMYKLPQLKAATNMLVCGEDLGMVPHCVPEVMQQLGILSLEIQRMPKNPEKEFFHPEDAPYLSVITPSTHDMSTIRGWWEENPDRINHFYKSVLGQWGEPPEFCEAWINRAIILQHLYSPAMWSIFQLQDILGMSETLRRENPHDERINNPANPKHYWQYRMHITLEELINQKEFNDELKGYIAHGGRG